MRKTYPPVFKAEAVLLVREDGMGVAAIADELARLRPEAAACDERLHRALALLDALRVGRVRERQLAVPALERLLAERDRDAVWVRERGADVRH